MKTAKLNTQRGFNPYTLHNVQLEAFIFFDEKGPVLEHKKGWFGENRREHKLPLLEELEFKKVNKPEIHYKHNKPFLCGQTAYLPVTLLGFEYLGERVAMETELEVCYLHYFMLEGIKFSAPYYSKTVDTPNGAKYRKVSAALRKKRIDVSRWQVSDLIAVLEELSVVVVKGEFKS